MDTRTRTASPTADDEHAKPATPPPVQDKISAYYSLVFPHFTFYIQTLSITIGRRCAPNAATSSTAEQSQVDVDLGALKSVSRLHAKIEYDQEDDRFVLVVIGRNGAWVDGVWSGAGSRAPLGERSQIQIASRTFHFVLPPPPPPEDTPSPSSQSSVNRVRSPSVDITSISPPSSQPSHTPPPEVKLPPPSPEPQLPPKPKPKAQPQIHQPELPNSNAIGKSTKANSKKRKKSDVDPPPIIERPKPDVMPSKPPFTYAQLIYRAIKDIGGKATLQEICTWIMNTHEYYRYADGAWMSSVRHNLSSGRAFLKGERCGGDRGKGFFWSVDGKYSQALEEQEMKVQQAAAAAAQGITPIPESSSKSRKKDKGALLEPALKRSIKGDAKGGPLPPPLTSTPLAFKTIAAPITSASTSTLAGSTTASAAHTTSPNLRSSITTTTSATTGVFAYPSHPNQSQQASTLISGYPGAGPSGTNPYAALAQTHWVPPNGASKASGESSSTSATSALISSQPSTAAQSAVPDVIIPIILGSIPPTHPDYAPGHPNNSAKEGYMVLHERKLILDPDVFAELTKEMLEQLEKMGAPTALGILTGHMIRALKERRARERGKDRGARRLKVAGRGAARKAAVVTAPFTKVPLDQTRRSTSGSCDKPMEVSDRATPADTDMDTQHPSSIPTSQLSATTSRDSDTPHTTSATPSVDPGSPLIVIDEDSDDEGPATKKRKVDGGVALT